MAHNTPDVIEIITPGRQQSKRRASDSDNNPKRLRTGEEPEMRAVEKYVTKEEFNTCIRRISRIEERLAKIERTFESLKTAFLGANQSLISASGSASSVLGPEPSTANSSSEAILSAANPRQASTSIADSAHSSPHSNGQQKSAKEVSGPIFRLTLRTPPSAVKSAPASAANSAQRTPAPAANATQQTPVSTSKSSQGTPVSTAISSQATPISAAKSSQATPVSVTKSFQATPVSAVKSAQLTPVLGAKKNHVTPPSGIKLMHGVPPNGTKPSQAASSSATKSCQDASSPASKSSQGTPISAAKTIHRTPPSATKTLEAQSASTSAAKPTRPTQVQAASVSKLGQGTRSSSCTSFTQDTGSSVTNSARRPSISVQGPTSSNVQGSSLNSVEDEEITVIEYDAMEITPVQNGASNGVQGQSKPLRMNDNAVGMGKPRINVIPQNSLLAAHPDQTTPKRNSQSYTQQKAGPSNVGCYPLKPSGSRPSSTSVDDSSVNDTADMPEEAFQLLRPKQEILDDYCPMVSVLETPPNKQLVAYIDGDCRKKKNHDIYAAVAGFSLDCGKRPACVPYVSDVKRPYTPNVNVATANKKMVELVRQQTEVVAALQVMQQVLLIPSRPNKIEIVARNPKLVQIMKNGFQSVYPSINICKCQKFPCSHPQRWESLDQVAVQLNDDLPRLAVRLAELTTNSNINVEWRNYFEDEKRRIGEYFKKEFKQQISKLLSQSKPRNS